MDERLSVIGGQQVMNVTADDIPALAHAIVSLILGQGRAGSQQIAEVSVVRLIGVDFDLYLRSEDWLKIVPYLADGTLNPLVIAADPLIQDQPIASALIEVQNPILYKRVYGVLTTLFTTRYPTTKI